MPTYSGPGFVSSGPVPLLQAESIDFKHNPDNKPVKTLLLGRAGHSPGAAEVTATVSNAVPAGGPEVDWVAVSAAQAEIPLSFTIAGKTYNCIGDVQNAGYATGVDSANKISFEFAGRLVNIL